MNNICSQALLALRLFPFTQRLSHRMVVPLVLTFTLGSLATRGQAQQFHDHFADGFVSTTYWLVDRPMESSQVLEESSWLILIEGGGVMTLSDTVFQQGLEVRGAFRFADVPDVLSIVLRSDLNVEANDEEKRGSLIRFDEASDTISILESSGTVLAFGTYPLEPYDRIDFRVTDANDEITLFMGLGAKNPFLEAKTAVRFGARLALYNSRRTDARVEIDYLEFREARIPDENFTGCTTRNYANGQKQEEGCYVRGIKDGLWQTWHGNGQLSIEENFLLGLNHGSRRTWRSTGTALEASNWKNGVRDGVETWFFASGQKERELHWASGRQHGDESQWNGNGLLILKRGWEQGMLLIEEAWWSNGTLMRHEEYRNNRKHGTWKAWTSGGAPRFEENWRDGLKDGREIIYDIFRPGEVQVEGTWRNGKKHGTWTEFFKDSGATQSHPIRIEDWNDGALVWAKDITYRAIITAGGFGVDTGERKPYKQVETFFKNGLETHQYVIFNYADKPSDPEVVREFEYQMVGGLKNGPYQQWWRTGTLRVEAAYAAGELNGEYRSYHQNGELEARYSYIEGLRQGPATLWHVNGQVRAKSTYKDGYLSGVSESWLSNGIHSSVLTYSRGTLEGKAMRWHANGELASIEHYLNGEKHGRERIYSEDGYLTLDLTWQSDKQHGVAHQFYTPPERLQQWGLPAEQLYRAVTYVRGIQHGETVTYWTTSDFQDVNGTHEPTVRRAFAEQRHKLGTVKFSERYSNGSQCDVSVPIHEWVPGQGYVGEVVGYRYISCQPFLEPDSPEREDADRSIEGRVTDAGTGRPIPGATVAVAGVSTATRSSGEYWLALPGVADAYDVVVESPGYFPHSGPINTPGKSNVRHFNLKPFQNGPVIVAVESELGSVFFGGVPLVNRYWARVDWNGHPPGRVVFETQTGLKREVVADGNGAFATFDMGADFITRLDPEANTLWVTAITAAGRESPVEVLHPIIAPQPNWASLYGTFGLGRSDRSDTATYALAFAFPQEPIELVIAETNLPAVLWKAWSLVPFVGGREFGIPKSQVALGAEADSSGSGKISGGASFGLKVAGSELTAKGQGQAALIYDPFSGWTWTEKVISVSIEGALDREEGVVTVFPALAQTVSLPVVGGLMRRFNDVAKIKGSLIGTGGGTLTFIPAGNGVSLKKANPEFGGAVAATLSGSIGDRVQVAGSLQGAFKTILQFPADDKTGYLDRMEAELSGKLGLTIWRTQWETEKKFAFTLPGSQFTLNSLPADKVRVGLISPDFLQKPHYAAFAGNRSLRLLNIDPAVPIQPFDHRIMQNIFPDAEPAIAARDGLVAIAYVHFEPGDPVVQSGDIMVTVFDGAAYSTPAPAPDGTRAEFNPAIAFDAHGRLVAAWERVKDPALTSDNLLDMARQLEIVFAVFDPVAKTWTEPVSLTENAFLDHSPLLRSSASGDLLLLWRGNRANQLASSADSPTELHAAFWNAAKQGFQNQSLVALLENTTDEITAAFDGQAAAIAFVRDLDGDDSTIADHELFYITGSASAWSAPARLTTNSVPDAHPQIVYAASGPELLWISGNALVQMIDWNEGTFAPIGDPGETFQGTGFQLIQDSNGHLSAVWQAFDQSGSDLFHRGYDRASASWSAAIRLTETAEPERDWAVAYAGEGALHIAHTLWNADEGSVDLRHVLRPLQQDAALIEGSFHTEPAILVHGQKATLHARVRNTGGLAATNITVRFFLGDPAANAPLIGQAAVRPSTLAAGASGDVSFEWTVPSALARTMLVAVISDSNGFEDSAESNNMLRLFLTAADIEVSNVRFEEPAGGSGEVIATIRNEGHGPARNIAVVFSAGGVQLDGRMVGELLPGESTEVRATFLSLAEDFPSLPTTVEVVADPFDDIPELDESNNLRGVLVRQTRKALPLLLPEPSLAFSSAAIKIANIKPGQAGTTKIAVRNKGDFPLILHSARTDLQGVELKLNEAPLILFPGEYADASIHVLALDPGFSSGTLEIETNDPDQPVIRIPISIAAYNPANSLILQVNPLADGRIAIEWPVSTPASVLQTSATLGAAAVWEPTPWAPVQTDDLYRVIIPLLDSTRFFRLHPVP